MTITVIFPNISEVISNIINLFSTTGTFPAKLKIARVTLIFKNDAKDDPINYRPISILPIFSKFSKKLS